MLTYETDSVTERNGKNTFSEMQKLLINIGG